jgi:gluconolactonase
MFKSGRDEIIDSAGSEGLDERGGLGRRRFLGAAGAFAATAALAPLAAAQEWGFPVGPERIRYPSGVWKVLDNRFRKYMIGNTPLRREWSGSLWAEGSAWNGVGRYVVFSDIPNNRQMRWDEVTGQVSLLRYPSNFSNGNSFDWQGRQLSCEHATARLVRYNWEGPWPEVLAAEYEGKPLNAPNDVVVHPDDDGIVFTDPGYGSHWWYEGNVRELELPTSVYHLDPQNGRLTRITDEIFKPNGLRLPITRARRQRSSPGTCRTMDAGSPTGASSRCWSGVSTTAFVPMSTATSGRRPRSAARAWMASTSMPLMAPSSARS